MGPDAARAGDRDLGLLGLTAPASMSPEPAISYSAVLRLAGAGLDAARAGDRRASALDVDRVDVEAARAGDRAVEASPWTLSTWMSPEPAIVAPRQLRDGDGELGLAVGATSRSGTSRGALRGWITSLSPLTSTTVRSSSFSPPLAETLGWRRCGPRRHRDRRPRSAGNRRPGSCARPSVRRPRGAWPQPAVAASGDEGRGGDRLAHDSSCLAVLRAITR